MIAIADMLVPCAEDAGIAVPPNADDYDPQLFPHWHVYITLQLGAPMPYPSAHFDNAKVIAQIPAEKITRITHNGAIKLGFAIGYSK